MILMVVSTGTFVNKLSTSREAKAAVTVEPNSAEKSFGQIRPCSAEKSKQFNN